MRYLCLLVVGLFLLPACRDAVSPGPVGSSPDQVGSSPVRATESPDRIAQIREWYGELAPALADGQLRMDTIDTFCRHEDGEFRLRRGYAEDGALVYLDKTTGVGHQFETVKYYFREGALFFVHVVDNYTGPASVPGGSGLPGGAEGWESRTEEDRYYLGPDGDVLRHLRKEYEEKGWEEELDVDAVPNRTVPTEAGQAVPGYDRLADWKSGRIEC